MYSVTLTMMLTGLSLMVTSCGVGPEILSSPASQTNGTSGLNNDEPGSGSEPPTDDNSPSVLSITSSPVTTSQQWRQDNQTLPTPLVFSPPNADTAKVINAVIATAQLKISESLDSVVRDNLSITPELTDQILDHGVKILIGAQHNCSNQQLDDVLTEKGIREMTRFLTTIIDDALIPVSTMSSGQLVELLTDGRVVTVTAQKAIDPQCNVIFMINISSVEENLKYLESVGLI